MYKFQFIALLLLVSFTSLAQTTDTLDYRKQYRNFHEFYRNEFSIFDSIIKVNDTIYMRPITVEPKIILHDRSEEHTSELQSRPHLVCRLLLEKKKNNQNINT